MWIGSRRAEEEILYLTYVTSGRSVSCLRPRLEHRDPLYPLQPGLPFPFLCLPSSPDRLATPLSLKIPWFCKNLEKFLIHSESFIPSSKTSFRMQNFWFQRMQSKDVEEWFSRGSISSQWLSGLSTRFLGLSKTLIDRSTMTRVCFSYRYLVPGIPSSS